jgi:hypothetical protein
VTGALDVPRGPDVIHRVRVARDWLESGATIEFELPRNLSCAACGGGGCDACERSGAISLRGRNELPELVRITLPKPRPGADPPSSGRRGITVRIPERGGLAEDPALPRGVLLLRVTSGEAPDAGISRVRRTEPPLAAEPAAAREKPRRRISWPVAAAIVLVLLLIALLAWLHSTGRG